MDPHDPELDERLARIESRLEGLGARLESQPRTQGGIGCLGFILFLVLFAKLEQVAGLVRALP